MRPGQIAFLALVLLAPIPSLTSAQEPARCAASGWETLRTSAQVIADVAAAKCAAGSRLDVAMTIPGQAVELQLSGLCVAGTVKTRTVTQASGGKVLGFRCDLAAR
jgi:cytoskeletal protein CcmA (bactofilin family)